MTILQNYLKTKRVQKALSTKPGEEGFSLIELVVVIAVLAILSAVAIPAFNGVQANARASAAKNGLVNIVKECIVLATDTDTTNDTFASSTTANGTFNGYTLTNTAGTPTATGSCYSATATPDNGAAESVFTILLNADGSSTKTCTNPESPKTAPGCSGVAATGTW